MNKSTFKDIFTYLIKYQYYEDYCEDDFSSIIDTSTSQAKITEQNVKAMTAEVYEYYKKLEITSNTNIKEVLNKFELFDTKEIYCFMILLENINEYTNDEIIIEKIKKFPKATYRKDDLVDGLYKARELVTFIVESERIDNEVLHNTDEYIQEVKNKCIEHSSLVFNKIDNSLKQLDKRIDIYYKSIENEVEKFNNDNLTSNDENFSKLIKLMQEVANVEDINIHVRDLTANKLLNEVYETVSAKICNIMKKNEENITKEFQSDVLKRAEEIENKMKILEKSISKNFDHFNYKTIKNYDEKQLNNKILKINNIINTFDKNIVEKIVSLCLEQIEQITQNYKKLNNNQKIDYTDIRDGIILIKKQINYYKKENKKMVDEKKNKKNILKNLLPFKINK